MDDHRARDLVAGERRRIEGIALERRVYDRIRAL